MLAIRVINLTKLLFESIYTHVYVLLKISWEFMDHFTFNVMGFIPINHDQFSQYSNTGYPVGLSIKHNKVTNKTS